MIIIAGIVLGALAGWLVARRRGGNRLDMAQYAAAYAIGFAVIGLFVTVILSRML